MIRSEGSRFAAGNFADRNFYFIYRLLRVHFLLTKASPSTAILALRKTWQLLPIFFLVFLQYERMLRLLRYTNHSNSRFYLAF